jgi:hypothetical protein
MLTAEQSSCLQIDLENGFEVPAQIHHEKQGKTNISVVLQWTLPLQAEFLTIGRA